MPSRSMMCLVAWRKVEDAFLDSTWARVERVMRG
jgi:hypothetical protein